MSREGNEGRMWEHHAMVNYSIRAEKFDALADRLLRVCGIYLPRDGRLSLLVSLLLLS